MILVPVWSASFFLSWTWRFLGFIRSSGGLDRDGRGLQRLLGWARVQFPTTTTTSSTLLFYCSRSGICLCAVRERELFPRFSLGLLPPRLRLLPHALLFRYPPLRPPNPILPPPPFPARIRGARSRFRPPAPDSAARIRLLGSMK